MGGENCEVFWENFQLFLPLRFEHWKPNANWLVLEAQCRSNMKQ
jgi:hypothetical protein